MEKNGRIIWIDAVKGIAILLVMLAHLSEQGHPVLTWLTYGYVPMFFVMSGITWHNASNWEASIKKRTRRLLIPYLFYGCCILIVASLLSNNVSFWHGLGGLLYGRSNLYPIIGSEGLPLMQRCFYIAPMWFLPCMWFSSVIMTWQETMSYKWVLPVLSLLLCVLFQYSPILLPLSLDTSFMGFLFVLGGHIISKPISLSAPTYHKILLFFICISIYYLTCSINGSTNMSLSIYGQRAPWSACLFFILGLSESIGFAILFQWMGNNNLITRFFGYLGRESLRLMCIHLIVGTLFYKGLSQLPIPTGATLLLSIGGVIIVNGIIAALINRLSHSYGKELISNL